VIWGEELVEILGRKEMGILRRAELEGLHFGRAIGDWLRSSGGCRIVNLGALDQANGTGRGVADAPNFILWSCLSERAGFYIQLHGHGLEHHAGDRACVRRDARRRYQSSTARKSDITHASSGFNRISSTQDFWNGSIRLETTMILRRPSLVMGVLFEHATVDLRHLMRSH